MWFPGLDLGKEKDISLKKKKTGKIQIKSVV